MGGGWWRGCGDASRVAPKGLGDLVWITGERISFTVLARFGTNGVILFRWVIPKLVVDNSSAAPKIVASILRSRLIEVLSSSTVLLTAVPDQSSFHE